MTSELPLVVAVDCLAGEADTVCGVLGGEASFVGVGYGWPAGVDAGSLLEKASVVILRSLHDCSGQTASRLSSAKAVVLTAPLPWHSEEELAAELHVRRLLRAQPAGALAEERADTELSLLLCLVRRVSAVAREMQRGAWLPSHAAYGGARRCSSLSVGLVGLDECTAGVARRCAAFGMAVRFVHPLPARHTSGDEVAGEPPSAAVLTEEERALRAAAEAQGAAASPSLAELLACSDVLCLHAPPRAGDVLGAAELASLRPRAVLVQTGTSGLHHPSLKKALQSGALAGAALDGPDSEVFLESTSRELPGLLLTQRCSAHSAEAEADSAEPAGRMALSVLREVEVVGGD